MQILGGNVEDEQVAVLISLPHLSALPPSPPITS